MKHKRTVVFSLVIVAAAIGFGVTWPILAARFGSPAMRQVVLMDWVNQKGKLSAIQKRVLLALLHKNIGDPDAAGMALAVMNARLKEDEDEIVRHLAYVAFTSKNPADCHVALSGLTKVSARHKDIAVGAFLHQLRISDPNKKADALKLVFAISGLSKFSIREALPDIEPLRTHSNTFLAYAAERAATRLRDSDKTPDATPK